MFPHAREHRAWLATRKARLPHREVTIHRLTVPESIERVRFGMAKVLPLLVCVSLSLLTVARATKPAHTLALGTKTLIKSTNTSEEVASDDDDSAEDASGDEGEDVNNDDGGGTTGDEGSVADDGGDDDGDDDDSGDEGE